MRDLQRLGALVVVVLACAACARGKVETRLAVRQLEAPAAAGSGEPNLAVAPDGRVLLSWIEPAGEASTACATRLVRRVAPGRSRRRSRAVPAGS